MKWGLVGAAVAALLGSAQGEAQPRADSKPRFSHDGTAIVFWSDRDAFAISSS